MNVPITLSLPEELIAMVKKEGLKTLDPTASDTFRVLLVEALKARNSELEEVKKWRLKKDVSSY